MVQILFFLLLWIVSVVSAQEIWAPLTAKSPSGSSLYCTYFVNSNSGFAVGGGGDFGTILKTTDGGAHWTTTVDSITGRPFHAVYSIDTSISFVVSVNGKILKTNNGGSSWESQTLGGPLYSIHFPTRNTGYALGSSSIFKTSNSGISWTSISSAVGGKAVFFTDSTTGYVVGSGIYKTTNGGSNWTPQTSGTTKILTGVFFIDSNKGWIVGDKGTVLRTNNGGINWEVDTVGNSGILYSVQFINASLGYTTDQSGGIFKTIDGGIKWIRQISNTMAAITSVHCPAANACYATGDDGILLKLERPVVAIRKKTRNKTFKLETIIFDITGKHLQKTKKPQALY